MSKPAIRKLVVLARDLTVVAIAMTIATIGWGVAAQCDDPWKMQLQGQWFVKSTDQFKCLSIWRRDLTGVEVVTLEWSSPDVIVIGGGAGADDPRSPYSLIPPWAEECGPQHSKSSRCDNRAIAVRAGWPFACVSGALWSRAPIDSSAVIDESHGALALSHAAGAPGTFGVPQPALASRVVPLGILPLGLAGNAFLCFVALVAARWLARALRRLFVRPAGRCRVCGYILGAGRCPECGTLAPVRETA